MSDEEEKEVAPDNIEGIFTSKLASPEFEIALEGMTQAFAAIATVHAKMLNTGIQPDLACQLMVLWVRNNFPLFFEPVANNRIVIFHGGNAG